MPVGGSSSETAAEARADMYDDALSDIPPWAINAAIKRWGKGDVPELKMGTLNFTFAPAPAMPTATTRAVSPGGCCDCWASDVCQPATMLINTIERQRKTCMAISPAWESQLGGARICGKSD